MNLETLNKTTHKFISTPKNIKKKTKTHKYNIYTLNDKDRDEVKDLCIRNVPFWNDLKHDDVEVKIITFAVTNLVFTATLNKPDHKIYPIHKVLVKRKSQFNSVLYDVELQYQVSKLLGDNNCGPRVIAREEDYVIQVCVEGETLTNGSFQNISVVAGLASSLAKFHKKCTEIAPKEWDRTPFAISRPSKWLPYIKELIPKYNLDFEYSDLLNCFETYKRVIENHVRSSNSIANSVLFCHNDLFYKNILDFQHGTFLIDFDYSGFNFVGWDFGTFVKKLPLVYNKPEYPYMEIDESLFLSDELMSIFVSVYISELTNSKVFPSDQSVKDFITSVEVHSLGIHLFWSLWGLMMIDRPSRESTVIPAFLPESHLHYNSFKKLLKKLTEANLIQIVCNLCILEVFGGLCEFMHRVLHICWNPTDSGVLEITWRRILLG